MKIVVFVSRNFSDLLWVKLDLRYKLKILDFLWFYNTLPMIVVKVITPRSTEVAIETANWLLYSKLVPEESLVTMMLSLMLLKSSDVVVAELISVAFNIISSLIQDIFGSKTLFLRTSLVTDLLVSAKWVKKKPTRWAE